jgi:hypothetical protein
VTTNQSATDTVAPNASHDHAGWRRRGDQRNRSAVAAMTSARASGQRTTRQTSANHPSEKLSPISRPKVNTIIAAVPSVPAVSVSRNARAYFTAVGRSRSMP